MRKIGQKLLLSSLLFMIGVSDASSGFLMDQKQANLSIGELRGTIGLESWIPTVPSRYSKAKPQKIVSGEVYLPDLTQIAKLANSVTVYDDQGMPLDMVATGSVGENLIKEVVWERFNNRGNHLREKFVK